ncbi:AAA ATPase [Pyrobaculum islandicum DSM 4184]|uniref:AAA ATPase n=1 Tax=Pyrobaculum islandicum (strain DSM 4184 / JCM 9189 / GEO3) TaxID=384616 RepID=A1RVK9_PYRIL|nr:RAD55 family ATPase [Pyrobaculum islandicum]ABL88991.1 AAA ATPase [Pyrobaculum islandicum DSM 4184]
MIEIAEVAKRGMTLIYGPPGSGKTSLAMRIASRIADKVLWVSTTEGPDLLREAARRVGVDPSKFDFYDFPRAFRQDIARYILDHIANYGAAVVDSVTGMATRQNIDVVTHSILYQIAKEKPIIVIADEDTPHVSYIADHVIHVWYRKNSIGHYIRYVQLEKSRTHPPGPRYIFDIIEGKGLLYFYPHGTRGPTQLVEEEKLGVTAPLKSVVCIHGERVGKVNALLEKIKDSALFIQIGHWTSFHGIELRDEQIYVVRTFHDLFKLYVNFMSGEIKAEFVVVGGLLNLPEEDRGEYVFILYSLLEFVKFLIFAAVGPREETVRLEKYCEEIVLA